MGTRRQQFEQLLWSFANHAGIDIRIADERFYDAVLADGFSGVRDAYVEGWWDTDHLDEVTCRALSADFSLPSASRLTLAFSVIAARITNLQSVGRANQVRAHYDLGDDLFAVMLDRRRIYSCAYWRTATDLNAAQEAKLDLVCRKLGLERGMRLLDIGCGWGGLARYAAENHGVTVVGLTVSPDQARVATDVCAGLPIEIRLADYRTLRDEKYDAIVSVGMFEHVGWRNYRRYMEIVAALLEPGGLFLLHTIGCNKSVSTYDSWMSRNIFPNAHLPSARQIAAAAEGLLVMEDWQNFGADYDRTLMAWYENFSRAWPSLRDRYGERFRRLWTCYLLTCAGSFRARFNQLWQVVFSTPGREGVYVGIR